MQDPIVKRGSSRSALRLATLIAALVVLVAVLVARAQSGPAFFVKSLTNDGERRESRPDILDALVLPGSLMKTVTLVAALESQVIEPETARLCRRTVTVAGRTYTCSHPDLKRPLSPAEALAHSCNDFFVSLFPRLTRAAFNQVRGKLGLPAVSEGANLAASFVGLDGPRVTPRTMLDVVSRLAGSDPDRRVSIAPSARRVLLQGLAGAAEYGSASALGAARINALAKTGTAPMPGGSWMGLAVALVPAVKPTRGAVVVAPGASGADAAAIAAELLEHAASSGAKAPPLQARGRSGGEASGRSGGALAPPSQSVRISINGRVNTLDLEDYVARRAAGPGHHRTDICRRESGPAPPGRVRPVRHDALPGDALADRQFSAVGGRDGWARAGSSGATCHRLLLGLVRGAVRACLGSVARSPRLFGCARRPRVPRRAGLDQRDSSG
jgi:hypothetical protein